jgi:hypothetical protein
LILKRNGFGNATIEFNVGETLGCRIVGLHLNDGVEESAENDISRALLSALLGKVDFCEEKGRVQSIAFEG